MDFKKKSRPFFIIIFKLKNGNFKTRDFSPLIERALAGVNIDRAKKIFDIPPHVTRQFFKSFGNI